MHELLRQFALERLEQRGEAEDVRDAHSAYYIDLLARLLPDLKGRNQLDALDAIEADFDNVRAAWHRACGRGRWQQMAEASQSLYLFASIRSRYLEGIELLEMAARAASGAGEGEPWPGRGYILAAHSILVFHSGEVDRALASLLEALDIAQTSDDPRMAAYCQLAAYLFSREAESRLQAIEMLKRAHAYFEGVHDPFYAAMAVHRCAETMAYEAGLPQDAIDYMRQQGLPLARQAGDLHLRSLLLGLMGGVLWQVDGPSEESERFYWEAIDLSRQLGEQVRCASWLSQVANMPLWREGDAAKAQPLLAEALAIAEEQGVAPVRLQALSEMNTLRLLEGKYEEALAVTEEVLASTAINKAVRGWINLQRGIALLGLGRCEEALTFLGRGISILLELNSVSIYTTFFPFLGIVFAGWGEHERAVELLACGWTQPHASGRVAIDPLITRFRAEMEEALGAERFAAAWERGAALDAMVTATEVLEALDASG